MKEVFIVRHGQCTDGARGVMAGELDPDLSLQGELQAEGAAQRLARHVVGAEVALYSSTKNRAIQTAQSIARALNIDSFMQFPALDERRLGRFTGLTVPEALKFIDPADIIDKVHTKFVHHPKYGCETFDELMARVGEFADYVRATHPDHSTPVVAMHGDSGRALTAVFTGQSMEETLDFPFHNGDILRIRGDDFERLAA